jgi:transcriptional regulator with XRE-family HTH domain
MPKRKTDVMESFGARLAELREAAGYTQIEFAAEVGITQRVVAYYGATEDPFVIRDIGAYLNRGGNFLEIWRTDYH